MEKENVTGTYKCPICEYDEPHTHYYRGVFSQDYSSDKSERLLKVGSEFKYGTERFVVEDILVDKARLKMGPIEYQCAPVGTANYRHEWFYITDRGYLMGMNR